MTERGRRAASLDQLRVLRSRFLATESVARGLDYRASPTDMFIATYPKCGTIWLQQILHCLRTGGDSDFDENTAVVPWLEMADALSIDPSAPQQAQPRVFKTHLLYERIPKGGRYIHMARNPADVLVSKFLFHEGWLLEPGAVSLEEHALEQLMLGGRSGNYWQFQTSWWPYRHDNNVLSIAYEQLLASPAKTIARIGAFAGLALDDELMALTLTLSGNAYMKAHKHQFDDHLFCAVTDPSTVCVLTVGQQRCEKAKLVPATRDCQPGCTQHSMSSGQRRWRPVWPQKLRCADRAVFEGRPLRFPSLSS